MRFALPPLELPDQGVGLVLDGHEDLVGVLFDPVVAKYSFDSQAALE